MKNILKSIAVTIPIAVFAIAVTIAPTSTLRADYCTWIPICDEYGMCSYDYECAPEYYRWQTTEPDWCLYENGDEVQIQYALNPTRPIKWYVTPANDPGRDGDNVVWDCWLYEYPF